MFYYAENVTRILLVKFQLNWSILKNLTFEPLYDPLIAYYYTIAYACNMFEIWQESSLSKYYFESLPNFPCVAAGLL